MPEQGKPKGGEGVSRATYAMPVRDRLTFAALGIIDLGVLSRWVTGDMDLSTAISLHVAALFLAFAVHTVNDAGIRPELACRLGFALVLGPLGGLSLSIATLGMPKNGLKKKHLSVAGGRVATGDGLSAAVYADHVQDRRPLGSEDEPEAFEEILASDDMPRQQKVVATISMAYRPEMLPALKLALTSNIPAIRVQAGAVYSKLLRSFNMRAKALLTEDFPDLSWDQFTSLKAEFFEVARCGFLDAEMVAAIADKLAAIEARMTGAQTIQSTLFFPLQSSEADRARNPMAKPPMLKRYSCGGLS